MSAIRDGQQLFINLLANTDCEIAKGIFCDWVEEFAPIEEGARVIHCLRFHQPKVGGNVRRVINWGDNIPSDVEESSPYWDWYCEDDKWGEGARKRIPEALLSEDIYTSLHATEEIRVEAITNLFIQERGPHQDTWRQCRYDKRETALRDLYCVLARMFLREVTSTWDWLDIMYNYLNISWIMKEGRKINFHYSSSDVIPPILLVD